MNFDATNSLKRCSSAPIINNLPSTNRITSTLAKPMNSTQNTGTNPTASRSRDASPTPSFNIFTPRARRYSTSFSPLAGNPGPCLTPRVSQLRQEECADINTREVNHEREVHTALQISQSWEDLTIDAENWSFKSDTDLTNPLHVALPSGISCSSPSPTSSRAGLRLPLGLSPSPTRRTFQTRRSMSPIAMRPSPLGGVKRKFELDESYVNSYSPPPFKRIFSDRGPSPCQSPLLTTCPSPDSTEGRTTPKFFISKLYANNTNSSSSVSSSPSAAPSPCSSSAMEMQIDLPTAIINNISNSDSKNSLDANDIESSKVFIDTITSNSGDDIAIDGTPGHNASEMKIQKLLNDSAELLIQSVDDDKLVDKKTDYFNVSNSNAGHINIVETSTINDFGKANKQIHNDESFEMTKRKLDNEFVISGNK